MIVSLTSISLLALPQNNIRWWYKIWVAKLSAKIQSFLQSHSWCIVTPCFQLRLLAIHELLSQIRKMSIVFWTMLSGLSFESHSWGPSVLGAPNYIPVYGLANNVVGNCVPNNCVPTLPCEYAPFFTWPVNKCRIGWVFECLIDRVEVFRWNPINPWRPLSFG